MEYDLCAICGRKSNEANLVNAVMDREKEITKLCENCAFIEKAVIIPKPTKKQLQETEVPYTVYERLLRMSGMKGKQKPYERKKEKPENISLSLQPSLKKEKTAEKEDIKILETGEGRAAVIDFSSRDIKIGDLQRLRRKIIA